MQTPLASQQYVICVIYKNIELCTTNLIRSVVTDKGTGKYE